ncbi:hypothetical protein AVEN_259428-1 [Araneus ventricosus]|uniref:Uncharacterized protein n=1 Tax=Araneus ventricosus TaxID=182803 RepID=A0A4Y2MAQ9_ARAVE|nr:hypothetical protein AVEN_259428-1 [Araneus ventricosus]
MLPRVRKPLSVFFIFPLREAQVGNFSLESPPEVSCISCLFSQHGPFPAYLKRFHLSDSDYCSCGGIGTALYYETECIYTVSWHMRKPAPSFEQEWMKRVANNLVSRHKIRGIVKFISENRNLFRPP